MEKYIIIEDKTLGKAEKIVKDALNTEDNKYSSSYKVVLFLIRALRQERKNKQLALKELEVYGGGYGTDNEKTLLNKIDKARAALEKKEE